MHMTTTRWTHAVALGCTLATTLACSKANTTTDNQTNPVRTVDPTATMPASVANAASAAANNAPTGPGSASVVVAAAASPSAAASAKPSAVPSTGAGATVVATSAVPSAINTAGASSARTAQTALDALATAATATAKRLATPPQMVASGASGNHYVVGYNALSGCAVDAPCTGTVTLTATGGYHINNEFPYKFVVDAAPGIEWQTSDGRSFGKGTGEFVKTGELTALISLRYRGKQAGTARLAGTFKMSVCSEANCQVESVPLAVTATFQ
jgi:hypothetical protein